MRQALVQLIGERKLLERKRSELAREFSRWERRAAEAQAAGESGRAGEALERCERIGDEDASVKAHLLRLEKEIKATEAQLSKLTVAESRSVNAEALLASLEGVTGPQDAPKRAMEELEKQSAVEDELRKLKERLERGEE